MAEKVISVGIVGGGIGGLTAALSLLRAGFDVHVFEQARTLSEVGAGIQVSPNASRIMHRLGLAEALAKMGVRPLAWHQRRWDDGRTLLRAPLGDAVVETFGFPHYQMHRADLLSTLGGALPAERVHVGHRFSDLVDHGDRVEARFENGTRVEVDLLVGADGIHSAVRGALFGAENPRFTGCVAYRGLIPADRLRNLALEVTAQVWMGPGKHFVHYFVQNQRLVNFVAIIDQDTGRASLGPIAAMSRMRSRPSKGGIRKCVASSKPSTRPSSGAMFDRAPLPRWSVGRVTLLGDACHPMLPFLAQGAAQAMEDGAALTACLMGVGQLDVPEALHRYETVRLPRASRIQAMSASNKTRLHLPDGPEQTDRDAQMATGSTDWSTNAVAWIYGHDAAVVEAADPPSRIP